MSAVCCFDFCCDCDIVSHLDAAVQYADLLEERPLTIDFGDYEMAFE